MALGVRAGHQSWHGAECVTWQGGRHHARHVLSVVAVIALGTKHGKAWHWALRPVWRTTGADCGMVLGIVASMGPDLSKHQK
eukprot:13951579-Ditylum_brightwellii.AAC.1